MTEQTKISDKRIEEIYEHPAGRYSNPVIASPDVYEIKGLIDRLRAALRSARNERDREFACACGYKTERDAGLKANNTLTKQLAEMTCDRDLWQADHDGDCPYVAQVETLTEANKQLQLKLDLLPESMAIARDQELREQLYKSEAERDEYKRLAEERLQHGIALAAERDQVREELAAASKQIEEHNRVIDLCEDELGGDAITEAYCEVRAQLEEEARPSHRAGEGA